MANEQNLVRNEDLTPSQRRANASKAGKASVKARRKRKAMKEQMEMLLSLPLNLKDKKGNELSSAIKKLGIDEKDIDNQMAMIVALWQTSINSKASQQIQAVQEIRKIVNDEQTTAENDKIQIINDLPNEGEEKK